MTRGARVTRDAPATSLPRLHLVTDDRLLHDPAFEGRARDAMATGGDRVALHLRGPGVSGRRLWEIGKALALVAEDAMARLFVNDRADVALALGLPRVHLGERSLSVPDARRLMGREALIGRSVHGVADLREPGWGVAAARPDYLHVGPVFETATHPGRAGLGIAELSEVVRAAAGVPVLGIGGVGRERVDDVMRTGAYGVAVIRAWWEPRDAGSAVLELLARIGVSTAVAEVGDV